MPIVVLIDVSLSMLAPLDGVTSSATDGNRRNAAISGAISFLEYLESQNRQEFVSLASFSDNVDLTDFTRDYASLKELLAKPDAYGVRSRTSVLDALRGVFRRCVTVWGSNATCHVLVLSDCVGFCQDFEQLVNAVAVLEEKEQIPYLWKSIKDDKRSSCSDTTKPAVHEFRHLTKRGQFCLHVVCVNSSATTDQIVQQNIRLYKKLMELLEPGGSFRFIDAHISASSMSSFCALAEEISAPSLATLRCGTFSSPVEISPSLKPRKKELDFDIVLGQASDVVAVLGFLKPSELGSPPIASRHLIIAAKRNPNAENVDPGQRIAGSEDGPNFCVLLHGAMKVEDTVAICEVGPGWYGYIHHVQNMKRSNLILHCFEPGVNAIPWLGPMNKLTLRPFSGPPQPGSSQKSPFPVPFKSKPSYATTNPHWIHTYGLQADVQKVLRYARKLPEKEPQFYQELSRVCNYALSLGFTELLITLARAFEKESLSMPPNSPQTVILKNVVNALVSDRMKYGDPLYHLTR